MGKFPIKVCFVSNRLVIGGAERHAVTLANRLDPAVFSSTFVTLNAGGPLEALLAREIAGSPVSLNVSRKLDFAAIRRLREHLERSQCDVIVAANPYPTLYGYLARLGARRPPALISTFHSNSMVTLKEKAQFPLYRVVFLGCETLVYVSENQRQLWRSRLVRARSDLTIHNGIDTSFFSPGAVREDREQVREKLGIASSDFVVGACAALRPEKGLPDLVHAVARLRNLGVPAHVLLIGDGPDRANIEATARRLRVADRIRITGFQMDVRPFVLACDTMALPSRTETFSLSALESMALGRPIVMTDVGGASEQITDGETGFLYGRGDIDALVGALLKLADSEVATKMGQAAAKRVTSRFGLDEMIRRYSELIAAVAARGAAR